jgi:hypothetical protein
VKSQTQTGLWLEEVPVSEPSVNDVLIRVLMTGICGTDLHIYHWDEWARATIPVPLVFGHEFVEKLWKWARTSVISGPEDSLTEKVMWFVVMRPHHGRGRKLPNTSFWNWKSRPSSIPLVTQYTQDCRSQSWAKTRDGCNFRKV